MDSPRVRIQNWVHRALYEHEGWPHDPLNRGISLALITIGLPSLIVGGIIFDVTGWDEIFPLWLSLPLAFYAFVFGWIALDEWRSRRRPEDDNGHIWVWQKTEQFWPQRRPNQAMVLLIITLHFSGVILRYIDRFTERDLETAAIVRLAELIAIAAVDIWLIILAVLLIRSFGPTVSFWQSYKLTVAALLSANVILPLDDEPLPWVTITLLLAVTLAFPGWLAHWIWRWRSATQHGNPDFLSDALPPWW